MKCEVLGGRMEFLISYNLSPITYNLTPSHMRRAFTLVELLLVLGIFTLAVGMTIPLYLQYQIRSDLDSATHQISQAIGRAQILSQSGERGGSWGVYIWSGVTLYQGGSYATRDATFDEQTPFPTTLVASGLQDVSFSPIEGRPTATGSIIIRAITGDERTVVITILSEGVIANETDWITVCHIIGQACNTQTIQDNSWPGHREHGDFFGICRDRNGDGDVCD